MSPVNQLPSLSQMPLGDLGQWQVDTPKTPWPQPVVLVSSEGRPVDPVAGDPCALPRVAVAGCLVSLGAGGDLKLQATNQKGWRFPQQKRHHVGRTAVSLGR